MFGPQSNVSWTGTSLRVRQTISRPPANTSVFSNISNIKLVFFRINFNISSYFVVGSILENDKERVTGPANCISHVRIHMCHVFLCINNVFVQHSIFQNRWGLAEWNEEIHYILKHHLTLKQLVCSFKIYIHFLILFPLIIVVLFDTCLIQRWISKNWTDIQEASG